MRGLFCFTMFMKFGKIRSYQQSEDSSTQGKLVLISYIENTSWKVLAYGVYARVVDVSEIERVSAANE